MAAQPQSCSRPPASTFGIDLSRKHLSCVLLQREVDNTELVDDALVPTLLRVREVRPGGYQKSRQLRPARIAGAHRLRRELQQGARAAIRRDHVDVRFVLQDVAAQVEIESKV